MEICSSFQYRISDEIWNRSKSEYDIFYGGKRIKLFSTIRNYSPIWWRIPLSSQAIDATRIHVDATIKNEIERVFRNFSSLLLETRSISGRRNAFAYNSVDKTIKHRLIFIGKFWRLGVKGRACNLLLAFSQRNKVGNAKFGGKKKKKTKNFNSSRSRLSPCSPILFLTKHWKVEEKQKGGRSKRVNS